MLFLIHHPFCFLRVHCYDSICGREISISAVFKTQRHKIGVDEFFLKCNNLKATVLLAHPAGVEPATLSTANCASRYTGADCNKQR